MHFAFAVIPGQITNMNKKNILFQNDTVGFSNHGMLQCEMWTHEVSLPQCYLFNLPCDERPVASYANAQVPRKSRLCINFGAYSVRDNYKWGHFLCVS